MAPDIIEQSQLEQRSDPDRLGRITDEGPTCSAAAEERSGPGQGAEGQRGPGAGAPDNMPVQIIEISTVH